MEPNALPPGFCPKDDEPNAVPPVAPPKALPAGAAAADPPPNADGRAAPPKLDCPNADDDDDEAPKGLFVDADGAEARTLASSKSRGRGPPTGSLLGYRASWSRWALATACLRLFRAVLIVWLAFARSRASSWSCCQRALPPTSKVASSQPRDHSSLTYCCGCPAFIACTLFHRISS